MLRRSRKYLWRLRGLLEIELQTELYAVGRRSGATVQKPFKLLIAPQLSDMEAHAAAMVIIHKQREQMRLEAARRKKLDEGKNKPELQVLEGSRKRPPLPYSSELGVTAIKYRGTAQARRKLRSNYRRNRDIVS